MRGPVGLGNVDQEPLAVLVEDRPERGDSRPGLDGDGHVGVRVVDHPVQARDVDRRAGSTRGTAVVKGRPPTLGVDGSTGFRLSRDGLADLVHGMGMDHFGRAAAVAERAGPGGYGPIGVFVAIQEPASGGVPCSSW